MATDTGMNDKSKLKVINRLNALNSSAQDLINRGTRSREDAAVLLDALQAFKEGRLAAALYKRDNLSPEQIFEVCSLEIERVPFTPEDQKYLKVRGVRYVGELLYVFIDARSKPGRIHLERMFELLKMRFDVSPEGLDPLALGWQPPYWNTAEFTRELNTLILERSPTPPEPDWGYELRSANRAAWYPRARGSRWRSWHPASRGVARVRHKQGVHYCGELIAAHSKNDHCPAGMRSSGDLKRLQGDLRQIGSRLWAGVRVPPNWRVPGWRTKVWIEELEKIELETERFKSTIEQIREENEQRDRKAREAAQQEAEAQREKRQAKLDTGDFSVRLEEFDFSVRTQNCLQNAGMETVGHLMYTTEAQLLKTRNFGRRTLNELRQVLADECGVEIGQLLKEDAS